MSTGCKCEAFDYSDESREANTSDLYQREPWKLCTKLEISMILVSAKRLCSEIGLSRFSLPLPVIFRFTKLNFCQIDSPSIVYCCTRLPARDRTAGRHQIQTIKTVKLADVSIITIPPVTSALAIKCGFKNQPALKFLGNNSKISVEISFTVRSSNSSNYYVYCAVSARSRRQQ